ncbi:uncharacterized protein LOC131664181 [Phymastichus coffea]|uniref:uncharacterized protein LOC131664181 n=1 Tax=Phymastichus coffea TaxID=108790 RepID=UPI00273B0272|nr:uncharacterized protein LOC131664181 [Phymastichus coffea]
MADRRRQHHRNLIFNDVNQDLQTLQNIWPRLSTNIQTLLEDFTLHQTEQHSSQKQPSMPSTSFSHGGNRPHQSTLPLALADTYLIDTRDDDDDDDYVAQREPKRPRLMSPHANNQYSRPIIPLQQPRQQQKRSSALPSSVPSIQQGGGNIEMVSYEPDIGKALTSTPPVNYHPRDRLEMKSLTTQRQLPISSSSTYNIHQYSMMQIEHVPTKNRNRSSSVAVDRDDLMGQSIHHPNVNELDEYVDNYDDGRKPNKHEYSGNNDNKMVQQLNDKDSYHNSLDEQQDQPGNNSFKAIETNACPTDLENLQFSELKEIINNTRIRRCTADLDSIVVIGHDLSLFNITRSFSLNTGQTSPRVSNQNKSLIILDPKKEKIWLEFKLGGRCTESINILISVDKKFIAKKKTEEEEEKEEKVDDSEERDKEVEEEKNNDENEDDDEDDKDDKMESVLLLAC